LEEIKKKINDFFVKYYDEYKSKDIKFAEYYKLREKLIYLGLVGGMMVTIYYLYDK
jgi:hypothetical protein